LLVIVLIMITHQDKVHDQLKLDVSALRQQVAEQKVVQKEVDQPFDETKHAETITLRTVSAKQIGNEMIKVDNMLTSFYKSNESLPEDQAAYDKIVNELEWAKKENEKLTGATEDEQIQTWKLNPAWTLRLDSVITYQDTDNVPILFSMTTKAGKLAGLISAVYDVNNHKIVNVVRHYTTDGLDDEVDVGGA